MADITCPVCGGVAEPTLRIGAQAICSICGASLFVESDGAARRSMFEDVKGLPGTDLDALRRAHAAFRRVKKLRNG